MVEMNVYGITLDPVSNMPIVILKGKESDDILSIWIGVFEANAISMKLDEVFIPRPMTHDLLVNMLESLNAKVEKVIINDLKMNTYYAIIQLDRDGQKLEIDGRPSDAINIAIRTDAPIFVNEKVLNEYKNGLQKDLDLDEEEIREWIEALKPEDFKKEDV